MYTLKEINQKLLTEEIRSNAVLRLLNEAINAGNIQLMISGLQKMDDLISRSMPEFNSLKTALKLAENEVNNNATNPKKSGETFAKVTSFYSKLWNFLARDLKTLTQLPAMKNFFNDEKVPDQNATLATTDESEIIKKQITQALVNDDSPWFKKALAKLTNNTQWVNNIPYINLSQFIDEFMNAPKSTLRPALEAVTTRINQVPNPEKAATAATAAATQPAKPTEDLEPVLQQTLQNLAKIVTNFKTKLGAKGASSEAESKIRELVLSGLMSGKTTADIEKEIFDTIK